MQVCKKTSRKTKASNGWKKPNEGLAGILMSTSCIGDISIIEDYGNIFSVYLMLEDLQNKSR